MVLKQESRLSKAIAKQLEGVTQHALQTRAWQLPTGYLEDRAALEDVVYKMTVRGYNTVLVPLFAEGEVFLRHESEGSLSQARCQAREGLGFLRHFPSSTWLYVDPILAGPPGDLELGPIAHDNPTWLMRTAEGTHASRTPEVLPGRFCWTSREYRRFLGNLLVSTLEATPTDGVVFDLRRLPRTTDDPATWTHLGETCLARLRDELRLDLEDFLTQPSRAEFHAVEQWRLEELLQTFQILKARIQKTRPHVVVVLLVPTPRPDDIWMPWAESYRSGVFDEVALHGPPEAFPAGARELDREVREPRPFLASVQTEEELEPLCPMVARSPASGFLVMNANLNAGTSLRCYAPLWHIGSALEAHPVEAALELLNDIESRLDPSDPLRLFYTNFEEYLEGGSANLRYPDVMKVRSIIVDQLKQLQESEDSSLWDESRELIVHDLDLVARLLLLSPASQIDY